MNKVLLFAVTMLFAMSINSLHAQRDNVVVVGSSTVYPFTTEAVDRFVQKTGNRAPTVRSTGTGGGFKLFCSGVGFQHPDFSNASRAIKDSERKSCEANGIKNIIEIKLGYDVLVLITSTGLSLELTDSEIFLALGAQVPNKEGKIVANPHKTWQDINPSLPNIKISFMGPPPTSGTRDSFLEMVMEKGAKAQPSLANASSNEIKKLAHNLRKDGAWADAGENDNLLVRKIQNSKDVIGIVGFNYYSENSRQLNAVDINGKTLEDSDYSLKRPLYIYAKGEHLGVIKGMKEFVAELTSKEALSRNGYLARKGLSPLSDKEFSDLTNKTNKELK